MEVTKISHVNSYLFDKKEIPNRTHTITFELDEQMNAMLNKIASLQGRDKNRIAKQYVEIQLLRNRL
ncbi:MAG: hypothetical protein MUE91_07335 [Ignavibacteriaceae bacterium]|jgi:hypothetical protein|nr:hypothetical protein [Ignavibacteriaceae bacterium]